MKKLIFYPMIACLFLLNTASTCSSDDNSSSSGDVTAVTNTVSSGTWRVTLFDEDGNDHTGNFNGYAFTFGASNVLTAANGDTTVTGYWSVTSDDSSDDDNDDDESGSGRSKPRVPGGSGCDDAGDIAEHAECKG